MQSAYRKHLSTETALLQVVNDIHQATGNKCEAVLVMLDLSVAFDTIDHAILLDRLGYCYGFFEMVLRWIESYLKDRPQCIALSFLRTLIIIKIIISRIIIIILIIKAIRRLWRNMRMKADIHFSRFKTCKILIFILSYGKFAKPT